MAQMSWNIVQQINQSLNDMTFIGILVSIVIFIFIFLHAALCIIRGYEYYRLGMRFGRIFDGQDTQFRPSFDHVKAMIQRRGSGWLDVLRPNSEVLGKRLFQYKGLYPVKLEKKANKPRIDQEIFSEAVKFFLKTENFDLLAILDIIYLREDNKDYGRELINEVDLEKYNQLVKKYKLEDYRRNYMAFTPRILHEAKRIVEGIGKTFGRECGIEILLHDVRNPIRSIVAAVNSDTVSGRHIGDPSTRFVVHYLENQGEGLLSAFENESKIGYEKKFTKGKTVKATKIPIYDDAFGLVGLLCLNIDIHMLRSISDEKLPEIIERLTEIYNPTPEFEKEHSPDQLH